MPPAELTEAHLPQLQALRARAFELVHFPLFAGYVGVKKGSCAALLEPLPEGRLRVFAPPAYVLDGNLAARVEQGGEEWFVWKSRRVRATEERRAALRRFEEELRTLLASHPTV